MSNNIPAPTVKLLLKELKEVTDWKLFGVSLDINVSRLKIIQQENPHEGVENWKMEMFHFWLRLKSDASWNDVVQALEQNDYGLLAAKVKRKYLFGINAEEEEFEMEVVTDANVLRQLHDLESSFAIMLSRFGSILKDNDSDFSEARAFLIRSCSGDFRDCRGIDELLDQLCLEDHIGPFNLYRLKNLLKIFESEKESLEKIIEKYEEEKEAFLKSTTVSQFQQAIVQKVKPNLKRGKALVTIKVLKEMACKQTLKDIEILARNGFEDSQKYLVRMHAESGSVIISWFLLECHLGKLEESVKKNAAVFADAGVEEVTVGGKIVFRREEDIIALKELYNDFYHQLVKAVSDEHTCQSLLTQLDSLALISDEKTAQLSSSKVTGSSFLMTLGLEEDCRLLAPLISAMSKVEQLTTLAKDMSAEWKSKQAAANTEQPEKLSDVERSGVQTDDEPMTVSPSSATESHKPVTTLHLVSQKTDIEHECIVCYEVLTEPFLTDCGHHICSTCRDHLLNNSKTECPKCREQDVLSNARCNKHFQRMVNNLQVRCSDYEEGCEWVGELGGLRDHRDPTKGQCGIACPYACGKYSRSSDMKEHTRHCHKRMISCQNCDYYNTPSIVTEKHNPICPKTTTTAVTLTTECLYNLPPIQFTIGDFSVKKKANEEWLSSFYTHSRGYKFCLKVHSNGIRDGSGSHLSVCTELVRGEYDDELKWPFEGDIQIELLNWKDDKNHHSATICLNRHNHTVSRVTSRDSLTNYTPTHIGQPDKFISHTDLAPTTNTRYLQGDFFKLRVNVAVYSAPLPAPSWLIGLPVTPHDDSIIAQFTISEYSKRKEFNNMYFSEPFTTSPHGYNFSIKVLANGCKSGKGSNITMSAVIMKGQHDDHLEWPFTGTIVIEVLNWLEDNRHHKQVFSIDPNDDIVRVTDGEYGKDFGFYKFISHASLPFNSSKNTQYLFKDCICVRVRKSRADDD